MDGCRLLLTVLGDLEELVRQGAGADLDRIRPTVGQLTHCVCKNAPDFGAAARVHGRQGITYQGRHYDSHTEVVYLAALGHYQAMEERVTGYPDDELIGSLDEQAVAARWPEVVADRENHLLAPGELARLASAVEQEQARAAPRPPDQLPSIFQPPGSAADRWSAAAAAAQAARLPAYRQGPPPAQAPRHADWGATDLVSFIKGEPADRFITKIGGLPYRPVGRPWPRRPSGTPMAFLAQLCFTDSTDVVGRLPGDVLVIFARDEYAFLASKYDLEPALLFEWYPLGLEGLVSAADVPPTPWKLLPCYGVVERVEEEAGGVEGTKLGGEPRWIQHELEVKDRFLFTLGQVRLSASADQRKAGSGYLSMGDAGLLSFFLQADGAFTWAFQCY
jgi:hypothetical protein